MDGDVVLGNIFGGVLYTFNWEPVNRSGSHLPVGYTFVGVLYGL